MKSHTPLTSAGLMLALLAAPEARPQDPPVVAPDMYKCAFQNEHARLCEVTIKPGAKVPSHSHPQHILYVLAPGKARIYPAGGEAMEVDFTTGQAMWANAETHHAENIGATEVKLLVIEFKALKDPIEPKARSLPPAEDTDAADPTED